MIRKNKEGNWEDEYKNQWNVYSNTKEDAERKSRSLTGCHNCFDCVACVDCSYCINCGSCYRCKECYDCIECFDCSGCDHCDTLKSSVDCSYCVNASELKEKDHINPEKPIKKNEEVND